MNIIESLLWDPDFDALNNIQRWPLQRVIKGESVSQHSYWVTFYTNLLAEEMIMHDGIGAFIKLDLLRMALVHDFDETYTGDMSHEVKHNKHNGHQIKELLQDYAHKRVSAKFSGEGKFNKMMHSNILEPDEQLYTIVKVADWISILSYANQECTMGNADMKQHFHNSAEKLKDAVRKSILALSKYENQMKFQIFNLDIYNLILQTNFQIK